MFIYGFGEILSNITKPIINITKPIINITKPIINIMESSADMSLYEWT